MLIQVTLTWNMKLTKELFSLFGECSLFTQKSLGVDNILQQLIALEGISKLAVPKLQTKYLEVTCIG